MNAKAFGKIAMSATATATLALGGVAAVQPSIAMAATE